ncbi:RNA polymerase sigma factor [Bacillus sp. FJAT-49736]|uniref:RNA polymerase sigma factor n=1 Tax=Bacillus sp. FJAT-49736 TaxID=2833582 RepID=UPI001BC952FA|nr:RNA polymerase sigma factor [Bacillus sp. FJAT-49736]MBS4174391.1 RNA polymerase sigma factor [Bacillus sp. FJAT-49736]
MIVEFTSVYDQYFDDIYRYVYVKTGNRWDAEDIVSETFRKAYENFSSLKDRSNLKAWLLTIARNTVYDYYRKKKSFLVKDEMDFYFEPLPFEDPFDQEGEMECLKKSLHHLSKEDLEITNLRYFAGLKFKEMSMVLERAEDTLRVKSHRITKKIGVLMKKCLGES